MPDKIGDLAISLFGNWANSWKLILSIAIFLPFVIILGKY
jgi:hypothetical protein